MPESRLVRVTPTPSPSSPSRQGYLVRGKIAPVFVENGAIAPEHAIDFAPDSGPAGREWERLRRLGAIRQAGGRWWLDMVAYQAIADTRSRAALPWLILGAVLIALIAVSFYRG